MKNTDFIKTIKDIYSNVSWNAISNSKNINEKQISDIEKAIEILNTTKNLGYNTLSLLIKTNYHNILFDITDRLTEDELSEQVFNTEFAVKLAPFVAEHILKRYIKVLGIDRRTKCKSEIVLNIDISKINFFITPKHEGEN